MSTKSKSASSETPKTKPSSLSTTRANKSTRGVAKSDPDSLQNARISVDRIPRSASLKPTRSPRLSSGVPDKKTLRILKPSELQAELGLVQEDLKKVKEKLVLAEKEKEKALDELKDAQRLCEEANEKLREALVAQKRAEENCEIEKFRAVEMEQARIAAAQKKKEEWQKEIETLRSQNAVDVTALLSATQELEKVKQELATANDAKNLALNQADDAAKTAEAHAEKVEALSKELAHLKSVLDSRLEKEAVESKLISESKLEIDYLRQELEKAKIMEEELSEKEATLEKLNIDMEAAKTAESYAQNLVDELRRKVEEATSHTEQAKRLERSASESLESVMKQLELSNESLHNSKSEIAALEEKVGLLEISIARQKRDLEESGRHLELAKAEASEMGKKLESLNSELDHVKEEKTHSLDNEKLAAASVQSLLEEKNKLINELETWRDEVERNKKAFESLESALHEVSSEARDAKEKLLSNQVEQENYATEIEDLKLVLKATNEKYESMLDDANHEINVLTDSFEQSKLELENWKAEWEQKELRLVNSVNKTTDDNLSKENEITRLLNLLKMTEEEVCMTKEGADQWKKSLNETESEVVYLKEVIGEAKAESMKLKESLIDRGNELQNVLQENEELRKRELASLNKVEELSKLLEEELAKKRGEEVGELTDSEKDYDMLPKVVEFSEQNGGRDMEHQPQPVGNSNGQAKDDDDHGSGEEKESAEVDLRMWESCKIDEKDLSPETDHGETEQDMFEDEVHGVNSVKQVNGLPSAQKKKRPLLRQFGNLLKKKGATNHK